MTASHVPAGADAPQPARPRVLVTTGRQHRVQPFVRVDALQGENYADALVACGLLPAFSPTLPEPLADAALDGIDGVVFSGGGDPDPATFGQAPHRDLGSVDAERDRFEVALYRAARARGLPILGICRGMQIIAVAEGGTMHQDLAALPGTHQHDQRHPAGDPIHEVRLAPGAALTAAFGRESVRVNSFHHQAVATVPEGLRTVATASDGVIEAIEAERGAFLIAVQWHPEAAYLRHPDQLAPFRAFADALGAG